MNSLSGFLASSFLGENRTEVALIVAAGAGVFLGSRLADPSARKFVTGGSLALGAWAGLRMVYKQGGSLEGAVGGAAALPYGAGSWFEQLLGLGGRLTGNEPAPGIVATPDMPADPAKGGPYLGQPRNALRVAGKIRYPESGQVAKLPWGADTIALDAAVENQSSEPRSGRIKVRSIVGEGAYRYVEGPDVTLKPGEFFTVAIRVPTSHGVSQFGPGNYRFDTALQFDNYTLDRVGFETD